ncbi:hypothetical protein ETB97_003791 [Aspergillus alliaceus]|uniref:Uncharacterized protein n=1 Tax=Petromyces alliaceus TaxID=209559 RepID=A0A8H5ZXJ3_PETAA|nr:hypothetical protein ETB97_003791 [Aspergillus burnettii]
MTTIPWYTMLVASINEIIFGRGSNYMTSQEIAGLTPEAYEARVSGSKWVLVSEEMMVLTVWTWYWGVPAISDQCWSYYDFEIVVAVFHIGSDITLLAVAIPLIIPL